MGLLVPQGYLPKKAVKAGRLCLPQIPRPFLYGNIDDSFLMGYNFTSCLENVVQAVCTFQSLGFLIHPTKARVALERILFI